MNSRTKKFLSYYKPYLRLFAADMICAVIMSLITLTLPICARHITKHILEHPTSHALEQIVGMGALMIGLVLTHTLCNMFVDARGHFMGTLMERDMRAELFEHYQKLSFSFYDDQQVGQLMTRITQDVFWLGELYHHGPLERKVALCTLVGAALILPVINLPLTLIIGGIMVVMTIYALYFNKKMKSALLLSKDRIGDINAQVEDSLGGIRVVKSFVNEDIERRKFAHENERFVAARWIGYRSEALFYGGMTGFAHLITVSVLVIGGLSIIRGGLDLADLLTYLLYVSLLMEPIQRVINFMRLYQEGITGFSRFMDMLEIRPDMQDSPSAIDVPQLKGNISLRDVTFRYTDQQRDVLKNLSLTIQHGEYVALVGSSGVGKTTLCSLIPRFYDIQGGDILIDGHSIRDLTMRSLRQHIGVVQQEVYLFAGTVAENIGYGKPHASREEIINAARQANAHDFIMALPNGYDTDVGQRGVKLSGGQRQRLSIARVFLKNPPILILDEATSALDNDSERAIQDALKRLADDRTMLVIAHRLSTIRNAQWIVVLTDNGIEEQGTHQELLAKGGIYAQLYTVQLAV